MGYVVDGKYFVDLDLEGLLEYLKLKTIITTFFR